MENQNDIGRYEEIVSRNREAGQSIVLLALSFVILLLFVGLAVDVGFGFVRSSQFSRAIDSATLAGVVDLMPGTNGTTQADNRAGQFLSLNGWPTSTLVFSDSMATVSVQGYPQYTFTGTWPVESYFMGLLGINAFPITHSATAAFHAQAEMYLPTAIKRGHLRQAAQFMFGSDGCTEQGDAVIPLRSTASAANENYTLYEGVYKYRILIPATYTPTTVVIDLFDPDSHNLRTSNNFTITHSVVGRPISSTLTSPGICNTGAGQRCVVSTGEDLSAISENPFWLQRVDENWDSNCVNTTVLNNGIGDTVTKYELYYFNNIGNRTTLAQYTADGSNATTTDMKWLSPGADFTSAVGGDFGSFTITVTNNIQTDDAGNKFVFLDVTSDGGSSKNVWDLWAGPPDAFFPEPFKQDVNDRNLQIADSPGQYNSAGISVYALGRMPLEHYINQTFGFGIAPIDISFGDGTIYSSLFDMETGGVPQSIKYSIDTVPQSVFDIDATISSTGQGDIQATCTKTNPGDPLDCNNDWTFPQFGMGIPGTGSGFVYSGGILRATYNPGAEAHTLSLSITDGRPFLTE